jgi:hypothetical protein
MLSIMRVMKAYVNYFDTDGARARVAIHADDIRDDETVVQFSNSPEHWKMGRFEVESNCDILNRAHIHPKHLPQHQCNFEIEELGGDEFAIVCKTHPEFTSV